MHAMEAINPSTVATATTPTIMMRSRGQLSSQDLKSACQSVAIVIKLFAIDHIANDIYDYCRNAKQCQLESYGSGDDDNDEDHQRLSTRPPNVQFNLDLIKILLSDKIMNYCLIDI